MKFSDLYVALGFQDDKFKRGIKGAQKQTSAFSNQVKKLGGIIAGAFAVSSIVRFGKQAVTLAGEQEKAEQKLLTALRGRKDIQQSLIKDAARLQKITIFGDEETIEAYAQLAAFEKNEDALKRLMPLIQDMAVAMGMNLKDAALLVGKTLGSSTNALSRYGIQVEGAVGSNERLESAITSLNDKFRGQAESAANTTAGALTQLSNAWGDLAETIGYKLAPGLVKVAKFFKDLITPTRLLSDSLEEQRMEVNTLAYKLIDVNTNEEERKKILAELKKLNPEVTDGIDAENVSIETLTKNLGEYNKQMINKIILQKQAEKFREDVGSRSLALQEAETELLTRLVNLEDKFAKASKEAHRDYLSVMEDGTLSTLERGEAVQDLLKKHNLLRPSLKEIVILQKSLNDLIVNVGSKQIEYNNAVEHNNTLEEQRNKLLKELGIELDNFGDETDSGTDSIDNFAKSVDAATRKLIEMRSAIRSMSGSSGADSWGIGGMEGVGGAGSGGVDMGGAGGTLNDFADNYEMAAERIDQINSGIINSMQSVAKAVTDALAQMIEAWVKGEDDWSKLGSGLLAAVGGFMKELGAAMIAIGVLGEAFDNAIKSMQWYVALAAGVALVAAGAVLTGIAQKGVEMAEGGIVPAGYPGDTYPALLSSGEMVIPPKKLDSMMGKQRVEVVGVVRGEDIYYAMKKQESKHTRYSG